MPWKVRKRKSKYCVEKIDGTSVPGGCHDTQEEANAHQRALYANEKKAVAASGVTVMRDVLTRAHTIPLVWTDLPVSAITASTTTTGPVEVEAAEEETAREIGGVKWQAILAFEGLPTSDGRYLMPDQIEHRELPIPIMSQTKTAEGHGGARLAGRIDEMWWQESEQHEGVIEIMGRGPFADNEAGREALDLIEGEFLNRVSIDFAATANYLLDPETYEEVDTEGMDIFDALLGDYLTGFAGSIMGATFVPFSAFEDAKVEVITASGSTVLVSGRIELISEGALTASAAGLAPLLPPDAWFDTPETDGPCPLTVTDDGRVYGHIATWGQCHSAFENVCTLAPDRSPGTSTSI